MSEEHHRGRTGNSGSQPGSRGNSKKRGNSQNRPRSESKVSTTSTTTLTTSNGGRRRRGRSGKNKQQNHSNHGLTTEQLEQQLAQRKAQSAAQQAKNQEIETVLKLNRDTLLARASKEVQDKYRSAEMEMLEKLRQAKETIGYDEWLPDKKIDYDRKIKKAMNRALNKVLSDNLLLQGLPSRRKIEEMVNEKHRANHQLALPAPHGPHAHNLLSAPPSSGISDMKSSKYEEEIKPDAHMSYDRALWGAATHTRAGDSLKYL
jgi:hypothetical protein